MGERPVHQRTRKRLELRDIKTDRLVHPLPEVAVRPVFSASGDRLVARTDDSFQFFDVGTGKALSQLPRSTVGRLYPNVPELSPRGTYFAKNDEGDRVELYEVRSGKLLRTLAPKSSMGKRESILRFHFSVDEQALLGEVHQQLALDGGFSEERVSMTLWDVQSGEVLQELVVAPRTHSFWRRTLSEPNVGTMTLSHDRRLVALARTDGKDIEVWETASGTKRGVLAGHDGPVVSLSFSPDSKYLASGSEDTTVLVWDMHRPLRPIDLARRLKAEELAAHWETLSRLDAEKADLAVWSMAAAPGDAVPFLKERLRPAARPDAGRLKRLLGDLDSANFRTRSAAAAEIEAHGELILGDLEKALRRKNTLEVQRRLESLLSKAHAAARPFGTAERLRQWRALEMLERAATPEAVGLLRDLAGGASGALLTEEAGAALARLGPQAKRGR